MGFFRSLVLAIKVSKKITVKRGKVKVVNNDPIVQPVKTRNPVKKRKYTKQAVTAEDRAKKDLDKIKKNKKDVKPKVTIVPEADKTEFIQQNDLIDRINKVKFNLLGSPDGSPLDNSSLDRLSVLSELVNGHSEDEDRLRLAVDQIIRGHQTRLDLCRRAVSNVEQARIVNLLLPAMAAVEQKIADQDISKLDGPELVQLYNWLANNYDAALTRMDKLNKVLSNEGSSEKDAKKVIDSVVEATDDTVLSVLKDRQQRDKVKAIVEKLQNSLSGNKNVVNGHLILDAPKVSKK